MKQLGVFIATLAVVVLAVGAYAQGNPATPKAGLGIQEQKGEMMGGMMTAEKGAMAERQKMMAEMDAATAKLDELVALMDAADGARKVDAVASVVTELVAQQKQMRHRMMSMQPEMMRHMMAHMESGTMDGMQKSMSMCPMMKGADSPGASGAKEEQSDHENHHPDSKK